MNGSSVKLSGTLAVALIASFLVVSHPASAQNQAQTQSGQTQDARDKKWKYKRNKKEFDSSDLKRIPDLDGLPAYSGSKPKLMHGVALPKIKAGGVTNYTFLARERKEDVANWYRQVLSSNGWKVTGAPGGAYIKGSKGNTTCSVNVGDANQPGYASKVQILYQQGKSGSGRR